MAPSDELTLAAERLEDHSIRYIPGTLRKPLAAWLRFEADTLPSGPSIDVAREVIRATGGTDE